MGPDFTVALKRVTEAVATWARDTLAATRPAGRHCCIDLDVSRS